MGPNFFSATLIFVKKCRETRFLFYRSNLLVVLSACIVFAAVCPQRSSAQEFNLVHYGDLIDVDVFGASEFDWRGRLTSEGNLDGLNSFGNPIKGLCRSEEAIATDIKRAYSKFLREPEVKVRVIDRSGRPVVILDGAVRTPQRFQLNRPASLRELLVMAGGIQDDANGEVQIFRPESLNCEASRDSSFSVDTSNALPVVNITIKDLIAGVPTANPIIRSGDIITIRRAEVIYVIGGVVNPRQIASRTITTLSRAIATAGGLSKQADSEEVVIYRREGTELKRIDADLKKVETGEIPDPPLKAFDIVEVGVKGVEKRKVPPMITNQTASTTSIPLRVID